MLVQVDGWSGSGKSVLMYLLDGHPGIYSHPFHDIIQFLFRNENWNEEWVEKKDIWELRTRLARLTQYYKSESFIRQGKYVVEFKSNVHLDYNFHYDFSKIDEGIITKLRALEMWTPESVVDTFMENFRSVLMPHCSDAKHYAFMGGWRGLDNSNTFPQLYPNGKRIVIKRDIKDIIAVRTGRRPTGLNLKSAKSNSVTTKGLIEGGEIGLYWNYYDKLESLSKIYPDKILVLDFNQFMNDLGATMKVVCDFLNISFTAGVLTSTFLNRPIVHNDMDYASQVNDSYEALLSRDEIALIDQTLIKTKSRSSNIFLRSMKKVKRMIIQ